MIKKENALAHCSISGSPLKGYELLVSEEELVIRTKRHDKSFILEHVLGLRTDTKILLLPTIAGGIIAPLFLVAGINGLGDIWVMITIAFAGLMGLYFGLSGTDVLVVKTKMKEFDFTVFDLNPDLPHFCTYFNICLLPAARDQLFAIVPNHLVSTEVPFIRFPDGGLQVTTPPFLKVNPNFRIIKLINPLQRKMKFKNVKVNDSYIPYLITALEDGDFQWVEVDTQQK